MARLRFFVGSPAAAMAVGVPLALGAVSPGAAAATAGDPRDLPYLSVVVNQALETERTNVDVPWSNPETGNRGTIVIERTYYRDPQTPCRDYRRSVETAGRPTAMIRGTGCRIGPAVWRLEEAEAAAGAPSAPPPVPPPVAAPAPSAGPSGSASRPQSPRAERGSRPKPTPGTTASRPAPPPPADTGGTNSAERQPSLPPYTLPSKSDL